MTQVYLSALAYAERIAKRHDVTCQVTKTAFERVILASKREKEGL